jgi:glutamine phosphoribosylpyrophosphate amidotransferase
LLNVAEAPNTRATGADWGGNPDIGFMRYALNDPAEARNANPALLDLLQEAIRQNGRLGDVVKYMNDLLDRQPRKFSPLVVLDEDQARRRISGPDR